MPRSLVVTAIVIVVLAGFLSAIPRGLAADALHAVNGTVVSSDGKPLGGVVVSGWTSTADGSASSGDKNLTADDGSFTLHLSDGTGYVNAYYQPWNGNDQLSITVKGADISGLHLTMKVPPPRNATVAGIVTGADGRPLAGATVHIGQACCYAYGGAPPPTSAPGGTKTVNATTASSGSSGSSGSSNGATTAVAPTVMRPVYYNGDDQDATTGADGAFKFAVYAGTHQLTVTAKGYAQTTRTVDAVDGQTTNADVKLEKVPAADAHVTGHVVDAKTGAPIPNAQVSLSNLEWSRYLYNATRADGSFSFDTLPGWSQVSVYVYDYGGGIAVDAPAGSDIAVRAPGAQYYAYVDTLDVKSGAQALDIKLEAKPTPTIALIGYVVDPDAQKGVPGATVSVWNQDTGDWGSATTDGTGSYKLLVRPGHYTANAYAPGHLGGALTFVVLDGATTKRVDIIAPAGDTKYAPCDDCYYPPMPMGAEKSYVTGSSVASPGAATSDAHAPSGAPTNGAATATAPTPPSQATGANARGAATYSGTGGGLPAYTPEASGGDGTHTSGGSGAKSPIPFGGAALVVGAIALAAVAAITLRKRR